MGLEPLRECRQGKMDLRRAALPDNFRNNLDCLIPRGAREIERAQRQLLTERKDRCSFEHSLMDHRILRADTRLLLRKTRLLDF